MQRLQERLGTGGCLVGLDLHKHPACSPVDGHKQIAPFRLILHLRQILHIHVQIARLIAFKSLVGLHWLVRFQGIEIAHAVATQAPV